MSRAVLRLVPRRGSVVMVSTPALWFYDRGGALTLP
jgi:hypothetical protein